MKSRYSSLILLTATCLMAAVSSCGTGRNAVTRGKSQSIKENVVAAKPSGQKETLENKKALEGVTKAIIEEAFTWLGTKYVYGGHAKNGTDCSGMIMEIFLKVANLKLPRTSSEQQQYCSIINKASIQPGDLIFFSTGRGPAVSHVGLYIGSNQMIHASSSRGVVVSNIFDDYYMRHYHSSGRIGPLNNYASKTPSKKKTFPPPGEPKSTVASVTDGSTISSVQFIDLDEAINQKTDSIFNSFMD